MSYNEPRKLDKKLSGFLLCLRKKDPIKHNRNYL